MDASPSPIPKPAGAPSRFYQKDVTRAVRGFVKAGLAVSRAEIDPNGKIIIVAADGVPVAANEWDEVLR